MNTNKERSIRLRKRGISGSSFVDRKEVETLRHHGWEYWKRQSRRMFQNLEKMELHLSTRQLGKLQRRTRIGVLLGLTKSLIFGGKRMYLTRGRVQEFLSNRKQTSRHSLVVYGRYNIIDSEARSIFPRKSVPDHLLKYHLQVVYFVPVTTNESSPWKAWLDGARATWHEREMQWNFWQPPYWSNGVSRQSELEAESQYGLGRC